MENIERYYTPEVIVNISKKSSIQGLIRGIDVFKVALREYGFAIEMPEVSKAKLAYYTAILSVFTAGYIQGKQDERARRKKRPSADNRDKFNLIY